MSDPVSDLYKEIYGVPLQPDDEFDITRLCDLALEKIVAQKKRIIELRQQLPRQDVNVTIGPGRLTVKGNPMG